VRFSDRRVTRFQPIASTHFEMRCNNKLYCYESVSIDSTYIIINSTIVIVSDCVVGKALATSILTGGTRHQLSRNMYASGRCKFRLHCNVVSDSESMW